MMLISICKDFADHICVGHVTDRQRYVVLHIYWSGKKGICEVIAALLPMILRLCLVVSLTSVKCFFAGPKVCDGLLNYLPVFWSWTVGPRSWIRQVMAVTFILTSAEYGHNCGRTQNKCTTAHNECHGWSARAQPHMQIIHTSMLVRYIILL